MKVSVFDHHHYRTYLNAWIAAKPSKGRGEKSRFAETIRCHSAYITLVLQGAADLSLEQAALLNDHLGHRLEEAHFFLLLVQHARAGNRPLADHFSVQIKQVLASRLALNNRLEFRKALDSQAQATYYSSWHYGAIHVLLSVPEFRTKERIATHLNLPLAKVAEVLEFLTTVGLAIEGKQGFNIGAATVHLGERSPMIGKHHINWRLRAMDSLDRAKVDDLHYSSVATISRKDLPRVRAVLVKAIEEIRGVVKDSGEEELFCYTMDLFRP